MTPPMIWTEGTPWKTLKMVAVEGEQPRHEGPEKKFESLSPGLDTFSRLLEENCHGLDADSVFLLTQRVRAELAVIQHEVEESRVKLRKALLRERIHRRQQLLVDPKQPTLSNSAASTAEETQPSQGEPDQRSILENIGTLCTLMRTPYSCAV